MQRNIVAVGCALLASACLLSTEAHAHGAPITYSPYVHHQGETKLEFKGAYDIDAHDDEDAWAGEFAVGYGVTDFWETEVGFGFVGHEHEDTDVNALIWENRFQFAPKGELFIDPGLKIEYSHNLKSGPNELAAKLLLGKEIGKFQNLANIGISREVGEDSEDEFEYGFSYALAYQHSDHFAYGVEYYADLGNLKDDHDHFDGQSHRVGPAVYGSIDHTVGYEAGVLFGVSDHAPDATLKLSLEYEF